ncbi:MAG TPA: hypothetical protein VMW85_05360 [Methanomassiliicoccales archaeon]|nr:hypothetical protein [Methanomassiliicoccales archaeon]
MKFKVERICRTDSMSAIPMERIRFDLKASVETIEQAGHAVESQELYLAIKMEGLDVTIYPSGRMLIHPLNDKPKAKELAQRVFSFLIEETD